MALTMMRSNLDVCSTIGGTACDVVITDMKMWVQDGQMECVLSWLENAAASSDNSASTLQVADMADAYTGQMTQFLKFIKSR